VEPSRNQGVRERYIWQLFPAAKWAGSQRPDEGVHVLVPLYVERALEHLASPTHCDKAAAQLSIADLTNPSTIVASDFSTYREFSDKIRRPPYATSRIVQVEDLESVRQLEGWRLRDELAKMGPCWEEPQHESMLAPGSAAPQCETQCRLPSG